MPRPNEPCGAGVSKKENCLALDDDTGPERRRRRRLIAGIFSLVSTTVVLGALAAIPEGALPEGGMPVSATGVWTVWRDAVPPQIILGAVILLCLSAFFSGSETAFFSIHRLRLRAIAEDGSVTGARVAGMMRDPSRLLSTLLVGNMLVNVLFAVFLGTRVERAMRVLVESPAAAYAAAVGVCTSVLVLFGEITPKVFAVSTGERFARLAVFPLLIFDKVLAPVRDGLLRFTDALFRITRFHELRAAPFITDDEFKSVLSDGEAKGVLEEDERQIIQGILEFRDVLLREILVPRPDVVALPEDATVHDALDVLRHHEYSRMPVYRDSLDTVLGILVAKDLIPSFAKADLGRQVSTLMRPAHFVPETMTVHKFVEEARRHRVHLAIVVDEFGGTEGIVTLDDALQEVVGEILDEDDTGNPLFEAIGENLYRVEGKLPLDALHRLLGIALEDEEHETLAGFLMDRSEKVLEPGDVIEYAGARFTVEACEGKRALTVRVQAPAGARSGDGEGGGS